MLIKYSDEIKEIVSQIQNRSARVFEEFLEINSCMEEGSGDYMQILLNLGKNLNIDQIKIFIQILNDIQIGIIGKMIDDEHFDIKVYIVDVLIKDPIFNINLLVSSTSNPVEEPEGGIKPPPPKDEPPSPPDDK